MRTGDSTQKRKRSQERSLKHKLRFAQLLLLFVATLFGGCGCLFLFHLLANFFLALGADLRPLGALGLNHLFTAQQLDVAGCSSIALPPSFVDDAQVTAAAIAKTRRHS